MTLIKLCKPGMETDTQSLVDRIRQLEDKLENGVQIAAMPAAGGQVYNQSQPVQSAQPKAELPKAIPEDVKQAAGRWSAIVGEAPMPMKAYLKTAYPSLAGDGSLLVVVEDGLPYDYFKQPERRGDLENLISNYIGKEITITVQNTEQGRNPQDLFPDLTRVVDQVIDMEIEDMEEDEEEFM